MDFLIIHMDIGDQGAFHVMNRQFHMEVLRAWAKQFI